MKGGCECSDVLCFIISWGYTYIYAEYSCLSHGFQLPLPFCELALVSVHICYVEKYLPQCDCPREEEMDKNVNCFQVRGRQVEATFKVACPVKGSGPLYFHFLEPREVFLIPFSKLCLSWCKFSFLWTYWSSCFLNLAVKMIPNCICGKPLGKWQKSFLQKG